MSSLGAKTPPIASPRRSPVWRRPSDIMKKHRAKRSSSTSDIKPLTPKGMSPSPLSASDKDAVRQSMKRRNPFSCSPRKRLHVGLGDDGGGDFEDSDFMLFRMLKSADISDKSEREQKDCLSENFLIPKSPAKPSKSLRRFSPVGVNQVKESSKPEVSSEVEQPAVGDGRVSLPLDWSLKTKLRFVSSQPFTWCSPLKTTEEAAGLSAFVRSQDVDYSKDEVMSEHKTALQQSSMYWMHPNLPWLKLFPRMVTDNKIGKSVPLLQDEGVINSLHTDWTQSFTSIFQLLKARHCPYFYMCTHLFTVLFRTSGVGTLPTFNAIVTPTTRGFRESLRKEGIEFTLPLKPEETKPTAEKKASAENETPVDANSENVSQDEDDEDASQTEYGAHMWLESIGLDKKKFPELKPEKIKMQREGYKIIDNKPESTVYVEGSNTQALFNFLLNCKSCFSSSGVQYGLPPTILAPVAFKGATLKSLKVKHGNLRIKTDTKNQKGYSLELEGPILPNTKVLICDLLRVTQNSEYSTTLGVQDTTTSFNLLIKNVDKDYSSLDKCGLACSAKEYSQQELELDRIALREITCKDNLFTWIVS